MATINGTTGNDMLTGLINENNFIQGLAGDDTLTGANLKDQLSGGDGSDTLFGGAGDDVLYGSVPLQGASPNDGSDLLKGGAGDDALHGDNGNDRLEGSIGNDHLNGGVGDDVLIGGAGNDTYSIDSSGDVIIEGVNGGIDTVYSDTSIKLGANVENLQFDFTFAPTTLNGTGNGLDNILGGGNFDNVLNGAGGDDTLEGNRGADTLIGGNGADVFDYNATQHSSLTASDLIVDFAHLVDTIDLRTIDADTKAAGNQAFEFIGSRGFSGDAGECRFVKVDGAGTNDFTKVQVDVDGDRVADLQITLKGLHNLTAVDFEL